MLVGLAGGGDTCCRVEVVVLGHGSGTAFPFLSTWGIAPDFVILSYSGAEQLGINCGDCGQQNCWDTVMVSTCCTGVLNSRQQCTCQAGILAWYYTSGSKN